MARIFGLGNDALSGFVGVVSLRCGVLPSCRRGSTVEPSQPGEVVSKIGQADLDAGADQANGAHNQADPAFLGGADHRPSPASPISAAGDSSQKQSVFSGFQLGRFPGAGISKYGGLSENGPIDAVGGRHGESIFERSAQAQLRAVFRRAGRGAGWASASRRRPPGWVAGGAPGVPWPSRRRAAAAHRRSRTPTGYWR
jgi:hypothetical protein